MPANRGLSFSFLVKSPAAAPRRANPPIMKGISTEKLMYSPPIAPVNSPAQGPARMPLMSMGIWVKWISEGKAPIVNGMTSGGSDRIVDKAAIKAMSVNVFALFIVGGSTPVTLFPQLVILIFKICQILKAYAFSEFCPHKTSTHHKPSPGHQII